MVECRECGAAAPDGATTCERCGASLAALRTCPNCEQEYETTEPSCPACGHLAEAAGCAVHGDRTAPGACVVCGRAVCEECDRSEDVHYICPEHADIPVIEGWAQVYTTSSDMEAELIKENLQADGVDAEVLSQKDHTLTVDFGDLSPVRLLVPAYDYMRARELIERHKDAAGEVQFACPQCGEAYDPGEETCASCGASLIGASP
jgi:Double zinc ribbon/Putative prokaryotic signal transducing protein